MIRNKNREIEIDIPNIKQDCFAYSRFCCRVLNIMICKDRQCPFYKTEKQYKDDFERYPYQYRRKGNEGYGRG